MVWLRRPGETASSGEGEAGEGGELQLLPEGRSRVKAAEELPWPDSRVFSAPDRPGTGRFAPDSVIWAVRVLPRGTAGRLRGQNRGTPSRLGHAMGSDASPSAGLGRFPGSRVPRLPRARAGAGAAGSGMGPFMGRTAPSPVAKVPGSLREAGVLREGGRPRAPGPPAAGAGAGLWNKRQAARRSSSSGTGWPSS